MGHTKSAVASNNHNWDIGNNTAFEFETGVFEIIRCELSYWIKNRSLKIQQTPRSGDNGKDIEITADCDFDLFGIRFRKNDNDRIKIYIEIKSTTKKVLRDCAFAVNIDKNRHSDIHYYVLLTNAGILPNAYYRAQEAFRPNIEFILMDEAIIAPYVNKYHKFNEAPIPDEINKINAEYISSPLDNDPANTYRIYFVFRNYSETVKEFKLELATNQNWNLTEDAKIYLIEPNRAVSANILVEKVENGGDNELLFKLKCENSYLSIQLGNVIREEFVPRFVGSDRKEIINILEERSRKETGKVFCIWGDAGVGKSRLISEFQKKISGEEFYVDYYSLHKDNAITYAEMQKDFGVSLTKTSNFFELFNRYSNTTGKRIVIIDNFHSADKDTLLQFQKYYQKPNPLIELILIGRSDYSAGIQKYYDFIFWSIEEMYNEDINQTNIFRLNELSEEDSKQLIKSIIKDIPEAALEKIQKNSDNNPLFITQYIEYLLDQDLVYIANRNSVGITDINRFASKEDLPESIFSIYKNRIERLMKYYPHINFISTLIIFSFFEGTIETEWQMEILPIEMQTLMFLEEKRLIFYDENKNIYQLIHESLKNFLSLYAEPKNKKVAAEGILSSDIKLISTLSNYELGRLYLWSNQKTKSIEQFHPIIDSIDKKSNISNVNVDMDMFEYYDDIYELLCDNPNYLETIIQLLKSKGYIHLHHLSPAIAVIQCDNILQLIKQSKLLKQNHDLKTAIMTEKAHALLNSGENFKGERLLLEIQGNWLNSKEQNISNNLFDVFDRLCAVNIRFGYHRTAKTYNDLSRQVAKELSQDSLKAIAFRTRSKLYYLNSKKQCQESLDKVDEIFTKENNPRIHLNNFIYRCIWELTYDENSIDNIIIKLEDAIIKAKKQDFRRALIQSYEVMCAALIKQKNSDSLTRALACINAALNMSMTFGISSFEWQLYNMRAIIYTLQHREHQHIKECFDTAFEILEKQNLLYLGEDCLCYSNALAIHNILMFYAQYTDETTFYSKYSKILNVGKDKSVFIYPSGKNSRLNTGTYLYHLAKQKHTLFHSRKIPKKLLVEHYYIALT